MPEEKKYTYYAFISYSHKDEKWAKWLQRKLESYRLPTVIRKESELQLPERIAPVFLDTSDLPVGKLDSNINKELEESRYLIVICSPNSATPNSQGEHYVNKEVADFCALGREDRIIPVIVDGIPGDPECNCFCPKIIELGLLGLDATKLPKARIVSDVVAKILNLRPDKLWQREKRRIRRNNIIRASLALLLLAVLSLIGIWAYRYYIPYEQYYENIILKNFEPCGINRIKKENVRRRPYSWRLTYHKGRLKKAQYVNSRNYVRSFSVDGMAEIAVAGRFADNGFVQRLEFRNLYGSPLCHADITRLPNGSFRMDYKNPWGRRMQLKESDNGLMYLPTSTAAAPFTPGSDFAGSVMPWLEKENTTGLSATGYEVKLDEQGFITNLRFVDRYGEKCQHNFCEEISIDRTTDKIIKRVTWADGVGSKKQISVSKSYRNGRLVEAESEAMGVFVPDMVSDSNKSARSIFNSALALSNNFTRLQKIEYDVYGNISHLSGQIGPQTGKLSVKYLFDDHSFLDGIVGDVSFGKDNGKLNIKLNSHGDLIEMRSSAAGAPPKFSREIEYFPDGTPRVIMHKGEGHYGMFIRDPYMELDKAGNVVLGSYNDGTRAVYLKREFTRDNLTAKLFAYGDKQLHDKIMIPIPSSSFHGCEFHSQEFEYNRDRRRKSLTGRDTNGNIICKMETSYSTVDGVDVEETDYVQTPTRKYYRHVKYDKYHRETSIAYSLDREGKKPFKSERGFAKIAVEYDGTSTRIKRQVTYDENGNLCSDPQTGFAIDEREYDAYGNLAMRSFRDPEGKPCTMKPVGVYVVKYENRRMYGGKTEKMIALGADGKTPMKANDGFFGMRFEYETVNGSERLKCIHYFTSKAHIDNDLSAPREILLYNAAGQLYGRQIFMSPLMPPRRIRNYVRVSAVVPGSPAEKHGIRVNDIIIAAPGFDERKDCDLSFDEKCAVIRNSTQMKKEIVTARIDPLNGAVTINKHDIPPGQLRISMREDMLPDADFYNKITVDRDRQRK